MRQRRLLTLSIFSGVLLSLPFYPWFSGIILLVAFVPLLFVEEFVYSTRKRNRPVVLFGYAWLAFLIWNALTTWWIGKATLPGAVLVILLNSFFLAVVFWLFHLTKRNLGRQFGNFSLLVYWIAWEHLYLNAEISWPWLNLGNGFAKDVSIIQWYELTGALGGTLWILAVNLVLFALLRHYIVHKTFSTQLSRIIFLGFLIFAPMLLSLYIYNDYQEKKDPWQIGIVQPSIDPYHEKFSGMSHQQQMDILLHLSDSIADERMDYIVGPETAIHKDIQESKLREHASLSRLDSFVRKNPHLMMVLGMDSFRKYQSEEKPTPSARRIGTSNSWIDKFNSAVQIDTSDSWPVYHKSKLVVGVEKMPYSGALSFMNDLILDLGGTTGTRGTQERRETFKAPDKPVRVAPVICYESIYGEYITDYINNGADFIFVITNDGWWGETIGYRQHLHYARLRAIET
ncbi:MAG TPA: apolipoprotein N-acyltransferase, partial [Bacteroidales bacterium]|nr:apolipoprotein N-acyltransferase [Bacteroidales bacterium]